LFSHNQFYMGKGVAWYKFDSKHNSSGNRKLSPREEFWTGFFKENSLVGDLFIMKEKEGDTTA